MYPKWINVRSDYVVYGRVLLCIQACFLINVISTCKEFSAKPNWKGGNAMCCEEKEEQKEQKNEGGDMNECLWISKK